jgi:regulator of cell morphogenesis and NO signaling
MFQPTQSIAEVVLMSSTCGQVFQRYRIDFCCDGDQTIAGAARLKGLEVDRLVAELELAALERTPEAPDLRRLSMRDLVAYTVSHHHEPLRRTLPLVSALATKVSGDHVSRDSGLRRLEARVAELAAALDGHLSDEATRLFPSLAAGTLDAPAKVLLDAAMSDHVAVVGLLEGIRESANDFVAPEWACTNFRTLYSQLQWLELDVCSLIHLENYVLRPRLAQTGAP